MHLTVEMLEMFEDSYIRTRKIRIKYILIKQWRKAESFLLIETYDYLPSYIYSWSIGHILEHEFFLGPFW